MSVGNFRTWCYQHGMRWHAQNLSDDERQPMWRQGRAWVTFWRGDGDTGKAYRKLFEINPEWHVGLRNSAGISLQIGGGDSSRDVSLNLDVALARFYLTFDGLPRRLAERWLPGYWLERGNYGTHYKQGGPNQFKVTNEIEVSFKWHTDSLWWSLWHPTNEWHSGTPKWRNGNFTPLDFLLGRPVYSSRQLCEPEAVEVPMPERTYPATVTLTEDSWKRPRSPFTRRLRRAEISVEQGVPHPGKGENSYDCDDDATYSLTCQARTAEEAVGKLVSSVLRDRRRYGGRAWRPKVA